MKELVSDIMEKDVITVGITDPLKEVFNIFDQIKIRHIPVVTGDTLMGIVSYSDIAAYRKDYDPEDDEANAQNDFLNYSTVKEYMKSHPVSVSADQTITQACEIFLTNSFHAVPVTQDHKLVGILSTNDVIRYFMENAK